MAKNVEVGVRVEGFRWFREILTRTKELIERLEGEELSDDARRSLRSLQATLTDPCADDDACGSDLLGP